MAVNINMQQQEYNQLMNNLKHTHQLSIDSFKTIVDNIRKLMESNDGFQAEQFSQKVDLVLDVLDIEILPKINNLFQASEESIETMIETISNVDTVC